MRYGLGLRGSHRLRDPLLENVGFMQASALLVGGVATPQWVGISPCGLELHYGLGTGGSYGFRYPPIQNVGFMQAAALLVGGVATFLGATIFPYRRPQGENKTTQSPMAREAGSYRRPRGQKLDHTGAHGARKVGCQWGRARMPEIYEWLKRPHRKHCPRPPSNAGTFRSKFGCVCLFR